MSFPIMSGLVMQWFSGREIPLINGLNMSAASIGNAIALFTIVYVATALSGWGSSIALYSAIGIAFAVAWLVMGKERKNPATGSPAERNTSTVNFGALLGQRTTLLLGLSMGGPNLLFNAISSWLPSYYHAEFGMSLSSASSITGLFTLFGIPACILGGFLPMRTGLRKPFLVIPGLLITLAGLGTFLFNAPLVIYISIAVFGICVWIFRPSLITICMELPQMTPQLAAGTIAVAVGIANITGFFGPLIVGSLADLSGSYFPGLMICSLLSSSLLVGGLLLPKTGTRTKQPV